MPMSRDRLHHYWPLVVCGISITNSSLRLTIDRRLRNRRLNRRIRLTHRDRRLRYTQVCPISGTRKAPPHLNFIQFLSFVPLELRKVLLQESGEALEDQVARSPQVEFCVYLALLRTLPVLMLKLKEDRNSASLAQVPPCLRYVNMDVPPLQDIAREL